MKELIIIHAKTGAGKTTLERKLSNLSNVDSIVSTTTREKRDNEVEGIDYYFSTIDKFNSNSNIISSIQIGDNINWKYGISKKEFDRIKETGLISMISAQYVKDTKDYAESIGIKVKILYINVSRKIRFERLLNRGEKKESIKARFAFEDQYSIEELKNILGDIIVVNGEQSEEEVVKESLLKLGVWNESSKN